LRGETSPERTRPATEHRLALSDLVKSAERRCAVIDFHTHILPGIDDGSRDVKMTKAMLLEEKRQGVELIVATPHFYADRMSIDSFLQRRAHAIEKTEAMRRETGEALPALVVGAEVYYFQGMGAAGMVGRLCVGETRTLLVEMPFEQWTEDVLRDVERLIDRQGFNVVLAHVERYIGFQRDRSVWDRVMALDLTPQINAGSFIKKGGFLHPDRKRKFCLSFLKEHPRLILGSDCHNLDGRAPNIARARAEIERALGPEALEETDATVKRALAL